MKDISYKIAEYYIFCIKYCNEDLNILKKHKELSLSSIMRVLRKKSNNKFIMKFLKKHNEFFNEAIEEKKTNPSQVALINTLNFFDNND